jgi:hypothetical protein
LNKSLARLRRKHGRKAAVEMLERRSYLAVQVSFAPPVIDDPPDLVPVDFTIGRFNGGATMDLGVHYHWPGHSDVYEIITGNGDGSFELASALLNYRRSEGKVSSGDWNGDRRLDLYTSWSDISFIGAKGTSNTSIHGVRGFRNDGNGNIFDSSRNGGGEGDSINLYRASQYFIVDHTTADLTGDGKTDLVTIGNDGLNVWKAGTFPGSPEGNYSGIFNDRSLNYRSVNAIDVNRDGRRDLITTGDAGNGYAVGVNLQNPDGSFAPIQVSRLTVVPRKLRMADFNRDGKLDIAVLEDYTGGSVIDIAFGDGAGGFGPAAYYKCNVVASDFAIGDFDLDGRVDVVFTMPTVPGLGGSRAFGFLHNRGDGVFERAANKIPDAGTDRIDSADFNNDGKPDLIVRYADTQKLAVLLNTATTQNVITGTLFSDENQNRIRDEGEVPIANQVVYVDSNNNGIMEPGEDSTTTWNDGTWELREPNGTYTIRLSMPRRWLQTTPTGSGTQPPAHVVSVSGPVKKSGFDFGAFDQGKITGFVFNDINANGKMDVTESGRAQLSVYLDLNGDGQQSFREPYAVTAKDGRFSFDVAGKSSFDVPDGKYTVRTDVQSPWFATGAKAFKIDITTTGFAGNLNFGQTTPATISGHVYYDYAVNSRRDDNVDIGVGGLTVFLDSNKNGVLDPNEPSTTTSSSSDPELAGGYRFTNLYPDNYVVRLVKPKGYEQQSPTKAAAGTGGPYNTFAFGGFDTSFTDFGVFRPIRVTGKVFGDANGNKAVNTGEVGLGSVYVFIDYDRDGLADIDEPQRLTDMKGGYTLTSTREGTFNVRALPRSGYNITLPSSSVYRVKFTYGAATKRNLNFGFKIGAFSTAPYADPINISTGANPTALVSGDFNGDGRGDFIAASNAGQSFVHLGRGGGKFRAGQALLVGDSTRYMIAADVNGDKRPDLVAANEDSGASVLINNGDGTFQDPDNYTVTTNTYGVAAGDFDGDKKIDLALVGTTDGRVAILINKGDGTFEDAAFFDNTFGGRSVAAGDVNGDKTLDLVVANPGSDAISILTGDGAGAFTHLPTDITSGIAQPNFVALSDLNNDKRLDLIALNEFSDEVRVKLGKGDGTFTTGASFATSSNPTQVAVLDIDRDTKLDLIVSCRSDGTTDISGGVSILRGRGNGTFVDQQIRTAHTSPTAVAIVDLNGDKKLDILAANFFSDDISVLLNTTPS